MVPFSTRKRENTSQSNHNGTSALIHTCAITRSISAAARAAARLGLECAEDDAAAAARAMRLGVGAGWRAAAGLKEGAGAGEEAASAAAWRERARGEGCAWDAVLVVSIAWEGAS
jgi:hypothetical protein